MKLVTLYDYVRMATLHAWMPYQGESQGRGIYRVRDSERGMVYGRTTEEIRVEEKKEEYLCPLSWNVHHNMALEGYIESTCCCVQARFLGMETKILFLLLRYNSALFDNVFIALHLILNKYVR